MPLRLLAHPTCLLIGSLHFVVMLGRAIARPQGLLTGSLHFVVMSLRALARPMMQIQVL